MLYLLLFIVIFSFILKFRHTRIRFLSFFKRGFKKYKDIFGVYCFHGKQESGKTLNALTFIFQNCNGYKVYANLKSIKGLNYVYFSGLDELIKISESITEKSRIIIFYDELFTAVLKDTKNSKEVMKLLSQMRKKGVIFVTTAQEWLEIPVTWRRYCRFSIECKMVNILSRCYCIKRIYNGYAMKWNKDENEYVAPLIETIIEKASLKIANSYDTYEQI